MLKTVLAGTTALMIAGSALAFAQQPAANPGGERDHWRPSQADLAAFADARAAGLKAGLQLTPDQEKNWPAVEQAIRDMAKARGDRAAERHDAARSADPIARLRLRADAMTDRAAGLKKLADAAQPLYQSLSEDQKHRFAFLLRSMGPHREHVAEWREHRSHEGGAPK